MPVSKLSFVYLQKLTVADWVTATAYSLTDLVKPVTENGLVYECTTAGTSGASEPTWPLTPGDTVTDGTVTWTCRGSEADDVVAMRRDGDGSITFFDSNGNKQVFQGHFMATKLYDALFALQ